MSGGSVFNIGSQQAGAVYNIAGNQYVEQAGGTLTFPVGALSDLRSAVAAASPALTRADRRLAADSLDAVVGELDQPHPDASRIAHGLAHVARILNSAGALAGSADALRKLAEWLGPAGLALLKFVA